MTPKSVAVIGAGIIGTTCACFLKRDGHAVTLYDRGAPGAETSSGNSGILSPAGVVPIAMPGLVRRVPAWLIDETGPLHLDWRQLPRLAPWLIRFLLAGRESRVRSISAALAQLNGDSLDLLRPLLREAGLEALIEQKGMLYVFRTEREFEEERFATELRQQTRHRVEVLSASDMRALEPSLAPTFAKGVFLPDTAHTINPHRLVTSLAAYFERMGGTIACADVTRVRPSGPLRAVVVTQGERAEYDAVVIAAGVWSSRLTVPLGYRVPLESQRGYHVTIAEPGVTLNTVVLPVAYMVTVVPMEMGVRVGGTVEFAGLDKPPNARRAAALLRHGRATIPALRTDTYTTWMGHRPCTPDSLPVLGPAPRDPAIFFAFGHGHQGLLGASKTAQVIADLVADRPPAMDLTPFSVERF